MAFHADVNAIADVKLNDGATAEGVTPLHIAADKGFVHLLPLLLDAKADVNAKVGVYRAHDASCVGSLSRVLALGLGHLDVGTSHIVWRL